MKKQLLLLEFPQQLSFLPAVSQMTDSILSSPPRLLPQEDWISKKSINNKDITLDNDQEIPALEIVSDFILKAL
jgi:hypothetical protein